MTTTHVEKLVSIQGYLLLIHYNESRYWQFQVVNPTGDLFKSRQLFLNAEEAERVGRNWVAIACGKYN